jgi:hypothetical protein
LKITHCYKSFQIKYLDISEEIYHQIKSEAKLTFNLKGTKRKKRRRSPLYKRIKL